MSSSAAGRPDLHRIPLVRLFIFSGPALALAMMQMPVFIVLPAHYAMSTKIDLATVGTILLVGRIFDAVADPIIGFLSDRTRGPLGGRKPWMLLGVPIASFAVIKLFSPPAGAGADYLLAWSIALFAGWSLVEIPFAAWAAELSRDYEERSRIMTVRGSVNYAGMFLFMALPVLLSPWTGSTAVDATTLRVAGWATAFALPLLVAASVLLVPIGERVAVRETSGGSIVKALGTNRPLRLYAAVTLSGGIAGGLWSATVLLFLASRRMEAYFPLLLLTAWGVRLMSAPLWLQLIKRMGKHRVWALGAVTSALVTPLALLVHPGPSALVLLLVYSAALGFIETALMITPSAVFGDVIDYDTLKTGADQAGVYFSFNSLLLQTAAAMGGAIAFWILQATGYDTTRADLSPTHGLHFAFAVAPSIIYIFVGLAVLKFPIDARRQGVIRRRIEQRADRRRRVGSTANP